MLACGDVITRISLFALGLATRHVIAAPTSSGTISDSATQTAPTRDPTSSPRSPGPYGVDPSNDNSSPMTTIIIVCVVGSLALIGGGWGAYSCMVSRRKAKPVFTTPNANPNEHTTTMICIPGEPYPTTAMPALRYNSPYAPTHPNLEAAEVGPGVIIPPPPSYDVATGGRVPESSLGTSEPCRPVRSTSDSRWKDLLISQGRD
ncbi:hypothetical protein RhiJN_10909 [Ceratobasidium sp. AG-Ba]|nr:hypothetical protein RhiJN_10909 [Ceratobasidium sp. AG-Ba]QRW11640.1 hypothetical protein RhiLY_10639 [Ceratobasidium sp. AG-Ba]